MEPPLAVVGHVAAVVEEGDARPFARVAGVDGRDGVSRVRADDGDGDDGLVEADVRGVRVRPSLAEVGGVVAFRPSRLEVGLDAYGKDRQLEVGRSLVLVVDAAMEEGPRGEARIPARRVFASRKT